MSFFNDSIKVREFTIGGLDTVKSPILIGVIMLIVYSVALLANFVNIFVIIYDKNLHKPMYLLICNLAMVDILYTSSACPTMIGVLVTGGKTISYVACIVQMFAFHLGELMEMFALTVMAFDRLIAVSCPFQYHRYLTNARIIVLTYILWLAASGLVAVCPATVIPLPHCYNVLKYNYCNYAAVLRTNCGDLNYYFNIIAILIFFLTFSTFSFICLSYVGIIYFVQFSSNNDKMKMGSTCVSHLIVALCYYVPVFVITILTRFGVVITVEQRNGLNMGMLLGPSLVNPFVYCLRTKEIKFRILKMLKKVSFPS